MLTQRVVIQKITPNTGIVQLYQNYKLETPWYFETDTSSADGYKHTDVFPFIFDNRETFSVGRAGRETRVHLSSNKELLFADDYGVPAGLLIGILLPKGYFPEIFKFKDKPFIPTGVGITGVSRQPPGYFDLFINKEAEIAAITFMITDNTYFGFKFIAKPRVGNFPSGNKFPFFDDLFASLAFRETHPRNIAVEDLEDYKHAFKPEVNLQEIADLLNRLIVVGEAQNIRIEEKESIIKRLQSLLSSVDSAITIADSFVTGGFVAQFIWRLMSFLKL